MQGPRGAPGTTVAELAFRAVTKRYGPGRAALLDFDFEPPARRLSAILGPSGSGKSTLLRIAAGLEAASAGTVTLDGRDLGPLAPGDRPIAFLAQGELLFPHLNVIENVAFGLRACGLSEAEVLRRGRATLEMLGLVGYEGQAPAHLSGGQVQRVALARALVLEPEVILLDEPLANLDEPLKRRLRGEMRDLQRLVDVTMLVVTHDQAEAMAVADHIALLHEGRLMQHGTPREVYADPRSEYVAACLGDVEVLPARVLGDGRVQVGTLVLEGVAGAAGPARRVRLMVRPQAWRLEAVGSGRGMPGRIARKAYLGRQAEYMVACDLGEVLALVPSGAALHEVGAPVDLMLGSQGLKVLPD